MSIQVDPDQIRLYGTLGCHLCGDAEKIVSAVVEGFSLKLEKFDIIDDELILAQLADKIPVVELRQQRLNWPFNQADLIDWIFNVCQKHNVVNVSQEKII